MTRLARSLEIARVVGRYRLDELLPGAGAPPVLTPLLRANPWRLGARTRRAASACAWPSRTSDPCSSSSGRCCPRAATCSRGHRRRAGEAAGPRAALRQRRGRGALIEEALGDQRRCELFERFDREPMASASVAQVHSARTREGREVVVKVIRPASSHDRKGHGAPGHPRAASSSAGSATAAACAPWKSCATTATRSSTSSTSAARRPTPPSCGATSPAATSSTCRRCSGTTRAATSWSWSASAASR
jgi:hypothetical protein